MGERKPAVGAADTSKGLVVVDRNSRARARVQPGFDDKRSLLVETAVVTITDSVCGAVIGALMGIIYPRLRLPSTEAASLNPLSMAFLPPELNLAAGPLIAARNVAVLVGTLSGIAHVMERLRGKEDVQSIMVAGFGSGAMVSLVSGIGRPNPAYAVTSGFSFALCLGGAWKLQEKFSQPPTEDLYYSKTRNLLTSLGLQQYEKNFKRGLLNDEFLPLLTDSALQDVKIPPGPRRLILDRVKRRNLASHFVDIREDLHKKMVWRVGSAAIFG